MGERGGFYVRKWYWHEGTRFLVVAVVPAADDPGKLIVLGTLCKPDEARSARLGQALDEPVWHVVGLTARRRREDACLPAKPSA
jgi:hypothetical protein